MDDPRQNPQAKKMHKTQHSGTIQNRSGREQHGTTGSGGSNGHGGRIPCPGCFSFSRPFVFPRDFSIFVAVLSLKGNMDGKGSRFHSLTTLKLTQTPVKEKENKKKQGQAKALGLDASRKIVNPTLE